MRQDAMRVRLDALRTRVALAARTRTPSTATLAMRWSRAALAVAYRPQYGKGFTARSDEMLTTTRFLAVALNVRRNHVLWIAERPRGQMAWARGN